MWTHYKGVLFFEFSNGKSFEKSIMTNHNRVVNSMNWMQIKGTRASLLGKWKWMEMPLKFTRCLHDNIIYLIEAIAWCALILVMPSTSSFTLQVSDINKTCDTQFYSWMILSQLLHHVNDQFYVMDDIVPIIMPCKCPIICHGWKFPNYHTHVKCLPLVPNFFLSFAWFTLRAWTLPLNSHATSYSESFALTFHQTFAFFHQCG
jgi:hypothetical protein